LKKKKNLSGKEYKTILTKDTNIKNITDKQLIEELLKRALISFKDDGNTTVTVKLKDDSNYLTF
jgi:hypothetical protein